jgi:septal ring factor EnvC (AmiA/AmiB activator)
VKKNLGQVNKNLSQGKKNLSQVNKNLMQGKKNLGQVNKNLSRFTACIVPKHPHITKPTQTRTLQKTKKHEHLCVFFLSF